MKKQNAIFGRRDLLRMMAGSLAAPSLDAGWSRRLFQARGNPVGAHQPSADFSSLFMRGACSTLPQEPPSLYRTVVSDLCSGGFNVIYGLHGTIQHNIKILEYADRFNLRFVPTIHLICWIRFGDPPYSESGPYGINWGNTLDWFKLEGYDPTALPAPFNQGPTGTKPLSDDELALQVHGIVHRFRKSSHSKSILAFYAFDEPIFSRPGVVDRMARVHRAFLNCGNLVGELPFMPFITGIFFPDKESLKQAREYVSKITDHGASQSLKPPFLMYDCYVFERDIGQAILDYERIAREWVAFGEQVDIPIYVVPLGFEIKGKPTANEMRAQVYLALASGCKGVNWFRYESLKAMPPSRWNEVTEVNRELEILGPTLLKLAKIKNLAVIRGGGGQYFHEGLINTFQHKDTSKKYLFLASRDLFAPDFVEIRLNDLGYTVTHITDCLTGTPLRFDYVNQNVLFRMEVPPGGGKLVELG